MLSGLENAVEAYEHASAQSYPPPILLQGKKSGSVIESAQKPIILKWYINKSIFHVHAWFHKTIPPIHGNRHEISLAECGC